MKGKRLIADLPRDHQMAEEPDGGFCVSRINPVFIDDNGQAINMKLTLDKDLIRSPTIFGKLRERSNSSGYGSSNHSDGIYNDDFKDSPISSKNTTLNGLPDKKPNQNTTTNLIPGYSRSQSRWTETFRSDSEYYHRNSLLEPNFNDIVLSDKYVNANNLKNQHPSQPGSPRPRPRLHLPQAKKSTVDSKDFESRPVNSKETIYQNSKNGISNLQNYTTYESFGERRREKNQNPRLPEASHRQREMYIKNPGNRYRRESRASSLSSGSVTSSSGQGTLSTIPEGKLLTEDYPYFGDVLNKRSSAESDSVAEASDSEKRDNFDVLKGNSEVLSGHLEFAIPRPVWPPMDQMILARRKYDGWDLESNPTSQPDNLDTSHFGVNNVFSNIRKNSNFEIDLNLDPRFNIDEGDRVNTSNSAIGDRNDDSADDLYKQCGEINGKCHCVASKMLVKLSQVIESILLEAHSPRSALLTIRHELLGHIRNHDCSLAIRDVSQNVTFGKDMSTVEGVIDNNLARNDKDVLQKEDDLLPVSDDIKTKPLKESSDVAFPSSDLEVNFVTVHHGEEGYRSCEDAMRRLSIGLRSDRKIMAVTRAFGENDYTLNYENEVFKTKKSDDQKPFSKNAEPHNGQGECVNVKCDETQTKSEIVNQNIDNCDSNAKAELWERDNARIIGKETQAHREKPSIWQLYYMESLKTQQIKDEFGVKLKPKHIPYFPSGGRPEADFTLDMPRQELLSKKLRTSKKQRCLCRFFAWFLCLVVFLATVIVVSLILTRGRRVFGSMV